MDNETDSSITFDQNGYCNYCTDVIRRMPDVYFPGGVKIKVPVQGNQKKMQERYI